MLSAEVCAPDVPELPGGGIEDGETLDEAIKREWAEETGIDFNVKGPFQRFQHVRGFYADDRNEFWIYDQTFQLYHFLDHVKIGQKWLNPEGGTAGWEACGRLPILWLTAPSKKLIWFEQSGHEPFVDEPAKFNAAMVELVRPVSV
jgi:8-oxo-dGTP pyrophosphatase MutT (NUDIX family)